ncbi:bacillithiol system redox-active protein YtxJ [Parasediminibacterium sp. JCM 36343]|uniref:bacillithiol system redox-active protein YtxJ n=1 Tax=Parasediminibacterium sp. JCM 36343 TaxID=3374279 RepID=UPI0039788308
MDWKVLTTVEQLDDIKTASFQQPQVIFKHSTSCSISSVAKNRLDKATIPTRIDFYYLDLIKYRPVSSAIAEVFQVHHESPQVLVIKNGECIYDESHYGISLDEILEQAALPA